MSDEMNIVDIHYAKLLDWLASRQQIPADWQDGLKRVRAQVDALLPGLPAADVPALAAIVDGVGAGGEVGYAEARAILPALKAHVAASGDGGAAKKDWFGRYTNAQLAGWKACVDAYERGNLFLAEAARVLAHNTKYEVPALRAEAAAHAKQAAAAARRADDCRKTAAGHRKAFAKQCAELGIAGGDDTAGELREMSARDLPKLLADVVRAARDPRVARAAALHGAFVGYARGVQEKLKLRRPNLEALAASQCGRRLARRHDDVGRAHLQRRRGGRRCSPAARRTTTAGTTCATRQAGSSATPSARSGASSPPR